VRRIAQPLSPVTQRAMVLAQPMGRSDLQDAAFDQECRAFASAVIPFLVEASERMKGRPTSFSRRRLRVAMEALKRGYLLAEVEKRPEIPFNVKQQVATYTSGINKAWSSILRVVESSDANTLMSMILTLEEKVDDVLAYFEIREVVEAP